MDVVTASSDSAGDVTTGLVVTGLVVTGLVVAGLVVAGLVVAGEVETGGIWMPPPHAAPKASKHKAAKETPMVAGRHDPGRRLDTS
ncbi:MAG: hypothetical protein VX861_09330 [Actinomycetota bacterium]|nr:hypothetical protein [Actinomycetota bacterium]